MALTCRDRRVKANLSKILEGMKTASLSKDLFQQKVEGLENQKKMASTDMLKDG